MATFVDAVRLLQGTGFYTVILPFFLIFGIIYGLLEKYKPIGETKGVNMIVAVVFALLFSSVLKAGEFLQVFIPLISGFALVLVLIILIVSFMGVKSETIQYVLKTPRGYNTVLLIILLMTFLSLRVAYPELLAPALGEEVSPDLPPVVALTLTIFSNPLILSLIGLIVIFGAVTYYISYEKPPNPSGN